MLTTFTYVFQSPNEHFSTIKMTIEKHKHNTKTKENIKGKYATSTENRRMMWEFMIWPLVLQLNRSYFTAREYHKVRNKISIEKNIPVSRMAGGIVSLKVK